MEKKFVDPLQGRALAEGWDVNPAHLESLHLAETKGAIRTRFPPEPNGYAHFGHAKSMYFNFKEAFDRLAQASGQPVTGHVTFRYDDTNPEAESQEFIDSIAGSVKWMGWTPDRVTFTSDYFEALYDLAIKLIEKGLAYVCHQTGDEIEQSRKIARAIHAGQDIGDQPPESPWRNTSVAENLQKFRDMRRGVYAESTASLRMKIDMRHVNPNCWDPVAYRIMYHHHPRTGNKWCIYPTYDYSHCIVDAIEHIDYSICTLEFENRRESYYWLLMALDLYRPKVFEFARLDLTRTLMSKRKLKRLVETKAVRGWDDPRMPTLMGMRRRGFSKEMINDFMAEIGITRAMSKVDVGRFLGLVGRHLDESAPRAFGIVNPIPLTLLNMPEDFFMTFEAPMYPQRKEDASVTDKKRFLGFSRMVYVEADNCRATPDPNFFGFYPGQYVRLRYGPLIECKEVTCDSAGKVISLTGVAWGVNPAYDPSPSSENQVKPKGIVHWLSAKPGSKPTTAEFRLYDHLMPEDEDADTISPTSEIVVKHAMIEDSVKDWVKMQYADDFKRMQFERVGYFVADCVDSKPDAIVLNRIVGLNSGFVEPPSSDAAAGSQPAGNSRAELQQAQRLAKQERLKYPPSELFKRPGELEKWAEWDADGVPTRAAGETAPLSKAAQKKLRKEWEKHKEEYAALHPSQ